MRVITDIRFFQDHRGNLTGIQVKTVKKLTHYLDSEDQEGFSETVGVLEEHNESEWTDVTTEGIKEL